MYPMIFPTPVISRKKSEKIPMISPVELQINVNPKKPMNSPSTWPHKSPLNEIKTHETLFKPIEAHESDQSGLFLQASGSEASVLSYWTSLWWTKYRRQTPLMGRLSPLMGISLANIGLKPWETGRYMIYDEKNGYVGLWPPNIFSKWCFKHSTRV